MPRKKKSTLPLCVRVGTSRVEGTKDAVYFGHWVIMINDDIARRI